MKVVVFVGLLLSATIGYSQSGRGGYYRMKSRESLDLRKPKIAEQYADSVLMSAVLSNHPDSLMKAYQWLSDFYNGREDYRKSLQNFRMAMVYRDTLAKIRLREIQADNDSSKVLQKSAHQRELDAVRDQVKELAFIADRTTVNSIIILMAVLVLFSVIIVLLIRKSNQTSEMLKQTRIELEQIQSFREKLFTVLSFELKNSLTSFEKLTQGLASQIPSLNKDDSVQFLKNLHTTAGDLKVNLNNILQWAGFKTDSKSFHPERFDGKEICEFTIGKFSVQLEAKKLKAQIFMPPDGQMVYADKDMIQTVLDNLLSNAVEFTASGGDITFFSGRKDGLVTLGIKDTGIGISGEDLGGIFKVDKDSPSQNAGAKPMGLGLTLCKELVEKNGGRLYIESVAGQGTTVYFSLPENNS